MAMISIGYKTDKYGRPVYAYIDTDDLSDEEYAEYHRLLREEGDSSAFKYLISVA